MFALLVPLVVACGIVKDYRPQAVPALDAVCTMGEFHSGAVCLLLKSIAPCIDLLQRVLSRLLK